jgi:hypothetical protein
VIVTLDELLQAEARKRSDLLKNLVEVAYTDLSRSINMAGQGNYERNGGLLTLETMRRDRPLRKLIDALVLANADAIDIVRLHTVDREGQATQLSVAPLHQMRQTG